VGQAQGQLLKRLGRQVGASAAVDAGIFRPARPRQSQQQHGDTSASSGGGLVGKDDLRQPSPGRQHGGEDAVVGGAEVNAVTLEGLLDFGGTEQSRQGEVRMVKKRGQGLVKGWPSSSRSSRRHGKASLVASSSSKGRRGRPVEEVLRRGRP